MDVRLKQAIKNFIDKDADRDITLVLCNNRLTKSYIYKNSAYLICIDEIHETFSINSPILYYCLDIHKYGKRIYSYNITEKEFTYFVGLDKEDVLLEEFIKKYNG